jgi:tRNA1(Val) A37 N6-methylase TrmN6
MPEAEISELPQSTIDAFHNGKFYIEQPKGVGHRSGIDAMLLGATVPLDATGKLADLGAGAGAAGLSVASRSGVETVLVEKTEIMSDFARRTLALDQNRDFAQQCSVLNADVELSGLARLSAGLLDNHFDFVIMNPPFNETADRTTPDALKATAHAMSDNMFEKWIKTAAAILKARGQLSLIARPSSLQNILNACEGRFGQLEITNVFPRSDGDAIRVLVTGVKSSRARLTLRPPLIMHEQADGTSSGKGVYTQAADDLINGRKFL